MRLLQINQSKYMRIYRQLMQIDWLRDAVRINVEGV